MSFRGALSGGRLLVSPLPEASKTAHLSEEIAGKAVGVIIQPIGDLNEVANLFLSALKEGQLPAVREWNRVAWCLWTTRPAIAEHPDALEAVLARVARMERKRPYRQLASAYVMEFGSDRANIGRVASVLAAYAPAAGDPWSRLHTNYGIFDAVSGPNRFARMALNSRSSVRTFLESSGLKGAFVEGGFAEAVHFDGLKTLGARAAPSVADHLDLIRAWCLRSDGSLIYKRYRVEMARAAVDPFSKRTLDEAERGLIAEFLVSQFGDPRLKPADWIGMDDIAELLRRWLTAQSLRQFFDVVDKIVPHDGWRYRRAFWEAYFTAELIRSAWVVFGQDGAAQVRRSFGANVAHGVFRSGGSKPIQEGHAVLLLDLGQCVVADWSYDGYCNVWQSSDATRPQNLNAPQYTSDEVRKRVPSDRSELNLSKHGIFAHNGSENYVWQDRVARRLHELIGVRVPQSAYRVY